MDRMCLFDFVIVAATDTMIVLQYGFGGGQGMEKVAPIMRAFRIARVVRLLRHAKGLRMLSNTVIKSVPALANMFSLLCLLLFVFAVLGVAVFGKVANGDAISEHANFRNFFKGVMLLLRVSTGEAWHMLMFDCMRQSPQCRGGAGPNALPPQKFEEIDECMQAGGDDCFQECGSWFSVPYFMLLVIFLGWVAMNLLIGVVIDGFIEAVAEENLDKVRTQFHEVVEMWVEKVGDKDVISLDEYIAILDSVEAPVGYHGENPHMSADKRHRRIRTALGQSELTVYGPD